jgi:hypothetical protein
MQPHVGVWRSLVARSVRVGEVPSSNLGTPINRGGNRVSPAGPLQAVVSQLVEMVR